MVPRSIPRPLIHRLPGFPAAVFGGYEPSESRIWPMSVVSKAPVLSVTKPSSIRRVLCSVGISPGPGPASTSCRE
jgi:hypothetical protein